MMKTKILLATLIAFLILCVSCCSPQPGEPQPTADLDQMIERTVHQWLDVRVLDQIDVDAVQAPDADWRVAVTWADLRASLVLVDLGNVLQIRTQIEGSEFYNRGPPPESEVVAKVKLAIGSYIFEE